MAGWSLLVGATLAGAASGWVLDQGRLPSQHSDGFLAATNAVNGRLVALAFVGRQRADPFVAGLTRAQLLSIEDTG